MHRRSRLQPFRRTAAAHILSVLVMLALVACPPPVSRAAPTPVCGDPLTRAEHTDSRVALTFDVTWQQTELAKILATLDASDVKATFFVGGTFLALYGETVRQLTAHGHDVGTLGQRIVDLSGQSEQEVTTNLLASQSSLAKILGEPVRYFRPPLGSATPPVVCGARAAGLITVVQSLDAGDTGDGAVPEIVRNVVRNARPGEIIRLTASDWSPKTNLALPEIIQGLKQRGFKLVCLSGLVAP